MRLFQKLANQLPSHLDKKQIAQIEEAYLFAEIAHKGQSRSSGEPYITHPVNVAGILAEMGMDAETIMAALLHDVMEDSEIAKTTIVSKFGNAVALLVDGVSKLTKMRFENKAEAQAENFRKMILAMAKDIRVILVKLADRLHNMRTLNALRPEKRRRIARETLEVYVPLANRLGMHDIRVELENLSFQALYPLRYEVLDKELKKLQRHRKSVVEVIQNALQNTIEKHKLSYLSIIGRSKNLYSIYRKMLLKRLPLADILDVYAFRIIVDTVEDCYRVLGFVHTLYKPVPERFKDYIAIPKANGYQSLHTTLFGPYGVPIEIQIRTREMEAIAERGIAAHWLYKGKQDLPSYIPNKRTQEWLQSLVELQQNAGNSIEFVENVKFDLFPDEVYVFTPKGEIMALPPGASIVDFAYAVHSDIGNRAVGAKVDRQYAPLNTKLNNGQTVEIILTDKIVPNAAWLDFVITGKARSAIRYFLKQQQRSETTTLGKKLLENALQSFGIELSNLAAADIERVLNESSLKSVDDLYRTIGSGEYSPTLIAKRLLTGVPNSPVELTISQSISIKGSEGLLLHFAKCCHPLPGDPIIGYLEPGQGITVHVLNCHNVERFSRDPDRYLPLRWDEQVSGYFTAEIRMIIYDRRGILAEIATRLTDADVDIEDIKLLERNSGFNNVKFVIAVKSRQHLAEVIHRLRAIKDIVRINRNTGKRKAPSK